MVTIHEGGFDPDERSDRVLWEVDLIVGPHNQSAIGTLEERNPSYLRLVHLEAFTAAAGKKRERQRVTQSVFPQVRQPQ